MARWIEYKEMGCKKSNSRGWDRRGLGDCMVCIRIGRYVLFLFCYKKVPRVCRLEACLVYYLTVLQISSLKWISGISQAPGEIPCLFYPGGHLIALHLWVCISPTSAPLWHLHPWFRFFHLLLFLAAILGSLWWSRIVFMSQNTDSFFESLFFHVRSHSPSFQRLGSSLLWGKHCFALLRRQWKASQKRWH